jgi:hypothetical protein
MTHSEVQGYHSSSDEGTLYSIVIYVHQVESSARSKPISLHTFTDYVAHVIITFYAFQNVVIQYITALGNNMKIILTVFGAGTALQ